MVSKLSLADACVLSMNGIWNNVSVIVINLIIFASCAFMFSLVHVVVNFSEAPKLYIWFLLKIVYFQQKKIWLSKIAT